MVNMKCGQRTKPQPSYSDNTPSSVQALHVSNPLLM